MNSFSRANSHLRYWRYRRAIGSPFQLRVALYQWYRRFIFEAFGIGSGA